MTSSGQRRAVDRVLERNGIGPFSLAGSSCVGLGGTIPILHGIQPLGLFTVLATVLISIFN